jgi:hypothetical protein
MRKGLAQKPPSSRQTPVRVSWTVYQAEIRDTANFGIKNDESADTVLSALFAFLVVIFE